MSEDISDRITVEAVVLLLIAELAQASSHEPVLNMSRSRSAAMTAKSGKRQYSRKVKYSANFGRLGAQ